MNTLLNISTTLIFTLLFISSCGKTSTNPQENVEENNEWELIWSDEFDSDELDQEKWSYQFGTGEEQGLTGWGNNELQYYTDHQENVFLEDGQLHIVAFQEDYEEMEYTSARIRTIDKGDWQHGKIEVRAKLPQGQGIWPAIWMLPTEEVYGGWPKSGEIDIMEAVGHEPEIIHGTVHYGTDWPDNEYTGTPFSLENGIFADNFHTFSIEWEEDQIIWFVDGNEFYSVTPDDLEPHPYPFNEEFHLILNLAVGGNWPGNPDETTEFPQSIVVDYVRVYQID
ncbi:MAG: glycoside hydrolase family 16 protein [Balneolaceae bacterium]